MSDAFVRYTTTHSSSKEDACIGPLLTARQYCVQVIRKCLWDTHTGYALIVQFPHL